MPTEMTLHAVAFSSSQRWARFKGERGAGGEWAIYVLEKGCPVGVFLCSSNRPPSWVAVDVEDRIFGRPGLQSGASCTNLIELLPTW